MITDEHRAQVSTWLGAISGMFLVAGPTGSGKTTTLYALVQELKLDERIVITIEDPVEYQIDGITQMQVDLAHGFTFAEGVRAQLRLDPDYLLVGEIRDATSAQAAMEASSIGRALLSTLHSRDAVGVVTSLRNWDLQDHEIATCLQIVVAQRLVRQLCAECRRLEPPTEQEALWLRALDLPVPEMTWHPGRCNSCRNVGFRGRAGVFEVWRLTEGDYNLILGHAHEQSIREHLAHRGYEPLLSDGLSMVARGATSLEELRVLGAFFVPPPKTTAAEKLSQKVAAPSSSTPQIERSAVVS